jgi:hypothetical protein
MRYQLNRGLSGSVLKTDDMGITSIIPSDPFNTDWQEYQTWLSLGNEPEPADE